MKIAILTSGILPVPAVQGGAVENLIDFYLEFNDEHRLHDITVYSVWHPDVEKHPALKSEANHYKYIDTSSLWAKLKKHVYCLRKGTNEYYHYTIEYFLMEAMKQMRGEHYDIVLMENRPAFALKVKPLTDARIVYHLHNEKLTPSTKNASAIYDYADRIICVSDFITNGVKAINRNDTKCVTVHNGINLDVFNTNNTDSTLSRKALGLSAEDFVLVFSGRINREKGISELIQSMLLLKNRPDIKLLVIGSSFYGNATDDDPFILSLKEKAEPIKDNIIFTGFVPYKEMPAYLRMADLAVIPSCWNDPFPTTVLEAQAMGLPIIATRRGGIPEEVNDENAILLDTNEHFVDNLSNAILDLYEHPEKRKQMAAASRERAKLFDKDTYARNFFTALEL